MGTRSLVVFQNEEGEEICSVYRQYDGYPEGRGQQLLDFLKDRHLVYGFGDTSVRQSNGIEDLAAQWIAWEKTNNSNGKHLVGNVYIYPPNLRDVGEEFVYTVSENYENKVFTVTCFDVYNRCYYSQEGMEKWQTRT